MTKATPRFIKLESGCVRDTHVYVDDAGNPYLREWTPTLNPDEEVDHDAAIKLAADCTLLGGGWSLPQDPRELISLVDYTKRNPAIDTEAFPDTQSDWYWTAQRHASSADYAWVVNFHHGGVDGLHRGDGGYVRAVRRVPARQ